MDPRGCLIPFGLVSWAIDCIAFLSLLISAKQKLWSATSGDLEIILTFLFCNPGKGCSGVVGHGCNRACCRSCFWVQFLGGVRSSSLHWSAHFLWQFQRWCHIGAAGYFLLIKYPFEVVAAPLFNNTCCSFEMLLYSIKTVTKVLWLTLIISN